MASIRRNLTSSSITTSSTDSAQTRMKMRNNLDPQRASRDDCPRRPAYPPALDEGLGSDAPTQFWAAGPVQLLDQSKTGFFCSSQCPGSIILKTFDAITRMRDEGQVLIAGFPSGMDCECRVRLLRGHQPVIWVPARSIIGMHLKPELVPAFDAGRRLILSP